MIAVTSNKGKEPSQPPSHDPDEILRALRAIVPQGAVTELRALEAQVGGNGWTDTVSGYYDDMEAMARDACQIKAKGIYYIPNAVNPALLSRAANRIRAAKRNPLTSDPNIERRLWLLGDVDGDRPTGISATDAEHGAAIQRAWHIVTTLRAEGWPDAIIGDSGNGAHFMFRIDLPPEDDGLVQRCLTALDERFGTDGIKVDTTVHNPARIWKLPGTVAAKGDHTPQRPHRVSKLLHIPDELEVVSIDMLEALAAKIHTDEPARSSDRSRSRGKTFDVVAFLQEHGIGFKPARDWPAGGAGAKRWELEVCPFHAEHTDGSAFVRQEASGKLGAGCQHNSCTWGWKDLRARFDPDYHRKQNNDGDVVGTAFQLSSHQGSKGSSGGDPVAKLLTDVGNAARFVRKYGENVRFCYETGHWYIWTRRRWKRDAKGRIVKLGKKTILSIYDEAKQSKNPEAVVKHAVQSQRRDRINAMLDLAKPEVAVTVDELDSDPWLFNCRNGTVDLRTGDLREHRREDLITRASPVNHDPRARCPLFRGFINRTFAGDAELIEFVRRWLGMSMSGDVSEQKLPIFYGVGNNGKSVLLDTVAGIMGPYACQAAPELLTAAKHDRHPTEVADLLGRRLVVASETEHNAALRLQLIKRLTGDKTLKGRYMNRDFFEFERTHKLVLVTNNKPRIKENTEAVWRRVRLVPFNVVIPEAERDKELMQKLQAEWSGILAWLVDGCRQWVEHGLDEPDAVKNATRAYRDDQDVIARFMHDCLTFGDCIWASNEDVFAAYERWAEAEGVRQKPCKNDLFARLRERDVVEDKPRKIDRKVVRGFAGIGILTSDSPDTENSPSQPVNGDSDERLRRVAPLSIYPPISPSCRDHTETGATRRNLGELVPSGREEFRP